MSEPGTFTGSTAAVAETPAGMLLEVSGVFKFYGAHAALRDVSFTLRAGEILAVVGENGAGKSTLSKILAGVIQPDNGALALRGQPLKLRSPREAIEVGMSYIPQEIGRASCRERV